MSSNQDIDAAVRRTRASFATSISNFDANAILRGAQLTIVGALRALQNPEIFRYEHYRQAALAVCAGIAVRFLIAVPILLVKGGLWVLSLFINFESTTWDDSLIEGLDFVANSVLNVPFFLMGLMRYVTPTLDQVFMDSLQWVDATYVQKHKSDDPSTLRAMYYPNLTMYSTRGTAKHNKAAVDAGMAFLIRFGRKAALSLLVYLLSYVPVAGRFVLPGASFYAFNKAVGPVPASIVFGMGLLLPKRYLVIFLQSYFASRSLMRELLEPYFSRIKFSKEQKAKFFRDREGVLFGFGVIFYIFLRIPLVGVLIYGISEASTAYLVTKITDPPPPPSSSNNFPESQIKWTNKHDFLRLPLANLDAHNVQTSMHQDDNRGETGFGKKRYS
ncbi:MAG: hypothetical protein MMC23_005313 [Stictis urceolatum]|nr:hypothetical protein [Stictis urceolata]